MSDQQEMAAAIREAINLTPPTDYFLCVPFDNREFSIYAAPTQAVFFTGISEEIEYYLQNDVQEKEN